MLQVKKTTASFGKCENFAEFRILVLGSATFFKKKKKSKKDSEFAKHTAVAKLSFDIYKKKKQQTNIFATHLSIEHIFIHREKYITFHVIICSMHQFF